VSGELPGEDHPPVAVEDEVEVDGVMRSETTDSSTAPAVPLGYAGEYSEAASGLYDLRARQYDPAIGGL
jgi:hypothetical protein